MTVNPQERRQFIRAFFSHEKKISAVFSTIQSPQKAIFVQVVNISHGGVFFTFRSTRELQLQKGDRIVFKEFREKDLPPFSIHLEATIVWVLDEPAMEFVGVGSKFINLSPENKDKLELFIQSYL
jgi:c-di-GMP-binding flagellar brake protein YcgR